MNIDRAFIRIEEGLVHYRYVEPSGNTGALPLYMVHAGPVSSRTLEPLMSALGDGRRLIAPDTLGFGDSAPPSLEAPELAYYVDSIARVLDAMKIDKIDFYGSHTGAHIGTEFAITHPDRVRKLICDGISVFPEELQQDLLKNYAPEVRPDEYGHQFTWAWQFMRDQSIHFPYYRRVPEARTNSEVWPPEMLHIMVLDVLKALTTYDKGYKAVFRHDVASRMPLIPCPTMLTAGSNDPLAKYANDAADLVPDKVIAIVSANDGPSGMAEKIIDFLS